MVDCGLRDDQEAGEIATRMKAWIEAIQYGDEEHSWGVVVSQ
jgi:branched-chain amino acid aminotransferase